MNTYAVYHCIDRDAQLQFWFQPDKTAVKREHYIKVAEVRAETLEEVFVSTNTIDNDWQENANVIPVRPDEPKRSTSVGDVIVEGKQAWLVDRVGFVAIDATGWQGATEASLSQQLRRFWWEGPGLLFLAELEGAWCDGACWICAEALLLYVQSTRGDQDGEVRLAVVAGEGRSADHVVVAVRIGEREVFLDADGVSTEQELLARWTTRERLKQPRLVPYDEHLLSQAGIPRDPEMSQRLAACLVEHIGPFARSRLLEELGGAGDGS